MWSSCILPGVANEPMSRVPTQTGKPGKMEKLFPVREKSGNFVQTGKVREIWTKYWKSQGNLENFYFFVLFLIELFELLNCLIELLTSYTIWVGWP